MENQPLRSQLLKVHSHAMSVHGDSTRRRQLRTTIFKFILLGHAKDCLLQSTVWSWLTEMEMAFLQGSAILWNGGSASWIRILVVDDEAAIRRALSASLNALGFRVAEATRGEEALHLVRNESFDAVLLDVQMPGIGGMNTLVRLREMAPRLPILMLTVCDEEKDKVEALELGADDYITKPFSMRECVARIRSAVRRAKAPERPEDAPLQIGDLQVYPKRRAVSKGGQKIHLTRKEYDILYYLMTNAGVQLRTASFSPPYGAWSIETRSTISAPLCVRCVKKWKMTHLTQNTY